jgi:hypothetical protein
MVLPLMKNSRPVPDDAGVFLLNAMEISFKLPGRSCSLVNLSGSLRSTPPHDAGAFFLVVFQIGLVLLLLRRQAKLLLLLARSADLLSSSPLPIRAALLFKKALLLLQRHPLPLLLFHCRTR